MLYPPSCNNFAIRVLSTPPENATPTELSKTVFLMARWISSSS